jgi:low temperature requirement protein LtrA
MIFIMDYILLCLSLLNFVIQFIIWSQLFGKYLSSIKSIRATTMQEVNEKQKAKNYHFSYIYILFLILTTLINGIAIWIAKIYFLLLKYYFYISTYKSQRIFIYGSLLFLFLKTQQEEEKKLANLKILTLLYKTENWKY